MDPATSGGNDSPADTPPGSGVVATVFKKVATPKNLQAGYNELIKYFGERAKNAAVSGLIIPQVIATAIQDTPNGQKPSKVGVIEYASANTLAEALNVEDIDDRMKSLKEKAEKDGWTGVSTSLTAKIGYSLLGDKPDKDGKWAVAVNIIFTINVTGTDSTGAAVKSTTNITISFNTKVGGVPAENNDYNTPKDPKTNAPIPVVTTFPKFDPKK